jgi:hypothetical protein
VIKYKVMDFEEERLSFYRADFAMLHREGSVSIESKLSATLDADPAADS